MTCKMAIHTILAFYFLYSFFFHGIKNPAVWLIKFAAPSATAPPPTTLIAVFVTCDSMFIAHDAPPTAAPIVTIAVGTGPVIKSCIVSSGPVITDTLLVVVFDA